MAARTGAALDEMKQVWAQAADTGKRGVASPSFYRALEIALPLAWEDDVFVIGMGDTDGQTGGLLNTNEYQQKLERALQTITQNPRLKFRVIEGNEYGDWEYAKARDAAALANRQQSLQKQVVQKAGFGSWDEIHEQVSRLWAQTENRSQPTGRARYMDAAFEIVLQAMTTLYPPPGEAVPETTERGLSRVVERIAGMTNSDPAVIAFLLFQRRRMM